MSTFTTTTIPVNNNDNIRLATIGDVEFDLWGDTTGTLFTPAGAVGYSYTRNIFAPHPSMLWNPSDWTATDWISSTVEDYSGVGTYNYQTANYQYSVVSPTYQVSPTFTSLAPNTIYNVTIRDIVGGCTSTPIPLTVNPVITTPPPTVLPVTYCQNATAVPLTATPIAGGTLNWYGTNATGGTASAIAPTPSTTTLVNTTYYVSQTVGGCESPRAEIEVVVNATPVISISGNNSICPGDTTILTASGGVSYDWGIPGETNDTISVSPTTTTTYSVIGTDANDCSSSAQITVTVNAEPTASLNAGSSPICSGEDAVFEFIGTPGAEVTYKLNAGVETNI